MSEISKPEKRKASLVAILVARYIRFVWRSNKVIFEPENTKAVLEQEHPLILAVWHGQFILSPLLRPENIDARVLVARHGDANLIGQVMEQLGAGIILGAGAGHKKVDKGGKAALVAALKALKNDISVVLTADVPPGPARKVGLGVITMAKLSGKPIIPVAIATKRYRSAKSWSRFTINMPLTRQAVVMGEKMVIPKTARGAVLEQYRQQLEQEMNRITSRAYTLAGANPIAATPPALRTVGQPGLGLKSYRFVMSVARPVAPLILHQRIKKGKEDKARLSERYGIATLQRPEGKVIWFHCASVGETNAVLPLIRDLVQDNPALHILLTTMTRTSAELALEHLPQRAIHQYVPLDVPAYVDKFFAYWHPDMAVFVESEIWPNLLLGASAQKIPLILVNAIMSKKSFRKWRKKEHMAQNIFGRFDKVFAQSEQLALWYHRLGAKNIETVGNLKLDAPPPPVNLGELESLKQTIGARPVLLAASTHIGEDEIIIEAHRLLLPSFPNLLTLIVPRHPERGDAIQKMADEAGYPVAMRSLQQDISPDCAVYIANTIGEMGIFYSVAKIAFIGGSLVKRGGQNPIEAIKLDTAVLTGPHYYNQNHYIPLLGIGAVLQVENAQDIARTVKNLLEDETQQEKMKQKALAETKKMCGAKEKVLNYFRQAIEDLPIKR